VSYRGAAAALLILSGACGSATDDQREEITFRVGATSGLSELVPGTDLEGSSAAVADLVYVVPSEHIAQIEPQGAKLVLKRRSSSPYTAEQLASSMRYRGLVSARALDANRIEAVFVDEAARRLVEPDKLGFDLGPFAIESQARGRLRLRSRGNSAIDVIDVVEVAAADEWRKLMARELDVMSFSPSLYRQQFAGMGSVRLLDIPSIVSVALYFNVRDAELADAKVRRQIASGLNREAIAKIACGDPACAAAAPPAVARDQVALPSRLSLIVVADESPLLMAASVIRHELDRHGVVVAVEPLTREELVARFDRGGYQLLLGPIPKGERRFGRFLSPEPGNPTMTGFSDPDYDTAVAARDFAKAQAVLDREMPVFVLYDWRAFAAIDARFCGDVTPSSMSWRWMADLHLCDSDKGEGKSTP
jgi:hypothetical protein